MVVCCQQQAHLRILSVSVTDHASVGIIVQLREFALSLKSRSQEDIVKNFGVRDPGLQVREEEKKGKKREKREKGGKGKKEGKEGGEKGGAWTSFLSKELWVHGL